MHPLKERKILIKLIHITKNYKDIAQNGAWQDWLFLRFNERSCKNLSNNELKKVLLILNNKCEDVLDVSGGELISKWRPDIKGRQTLSDKISNSQIKHILDLLKRLNWNDKEKIQKFFFRQTGALTSDFRNLSKKNGTKIVIGLTKILRQREEG